MEKTKNPPVPDSEEKGKEKPKEKRRKPSLDKDRGSKPGF